MLYFDKKRRGLCLNKERQKYPNRYYISLDSENATERRVAERLGTVPWGFKTQYVISAITFYMEKGEPGFFEDVQKKFTQREASSSRTRSSKTQIQEKQVSNEPNQKLEKTSHDKPQHFHNEKPKTTSTLKHRKPKTVSTEDNKNDDERQRKIKKALSQFDF